VRRKTLKRGFAGLIPHAGRAISHARLSPKALPDLHVSAYLLLDRAPHFALPGDSNGRVADTSCSPPVAIGAMQEINTLSLEGLLRIAMRYGLMTDYRISPRQVVLIRDRETLITTDPEQARIFLLGLIQGYLIAPA
jgi:hypothetical protein